jgi:thiamine pyrophosphokinase
LQHGTVVVVSGGFPSPTTLPSLPGAVTVIAADGGVDRALELGLAIDLAVGDFDSVSSAGLAAAAAGGARIERHPAVKDATDLELALDAAIELAPARIVVVGSSGGRLDHLLGSILLLALDNYAAAEIDAYLGSALVHVVHGSRRLEGTPGELISLVPVRGDAEGVETSGLHYPLSCETLIAGSSRGISNVFELPVARVSVARGVIAVVRPGPDDDDHLEGG